MSESQAAAIPNTGLSIFEEEAKARSSEGKNGKDETINVALSNYAGTAANSTAIQGRNIFEAKS